MVDVTKINHHHYLLGQGNERANEREKWGIDGWDNGKNHKRTTSERMREETDENEGEKHGKWTKRKEAITKR